MVETLLSTEVGGGLILGRGAKIPCVAGQRNETSTRGSIVQNSIKIFTIWMHSYYWPVFQSKVEFYSYIYICMRAV